MLLVLFTSLLLAGCSPGDAGGADAPRVLRFAYLPSEEDPEGRVDATNELADRLAHYTGMEVEIIRAVSYAPTIEAMRAGKIDVIRSGGSFTYMIAHEKAGAEAIVAFGTSEGPGIYRSILVASRGSGLETLDDLVERAAEVDFAFVNPASTSGHLIPRAILESRGVAPDEDFAELIYTMNHTNSAMTIVSCRSPSSRASARPICPSTSATTRSTSRWCRRTGRRTSPSIRPRTPTGTGCGPSPRAWTP
jgi:phosphonate transport system substrate-binding protein